MNIGTRGVVVGFLMLAVGGSLSARGSSAEKPLTRARQVGLQRLHRHLQDLRISGAAHGLVERRSRTDERGTSHIHYQQLYRGWRSSRARSSPTSTTGTRSS